MRSADWNPLDARALTLAALLHAGALAAVWKPSPPAPREEPLALIASLITPEPAMAAPEPPASRPPTLPPVQVRPAPTPPPMPVREAALPQPAAPVVEPVKPMPVAEPLVTPPQPAAAVEPPLIKAEPVIARPEPLRAAPSAPAIREAAPTMQTRDEYRAYLADLRRTLARYKKYPVAMKKAKVEGTVLLRFTINQYGRLVASAVKASSGAPELDQAALDMLVRAIPLPGIPGALDVRELTLEIPIEYSLITDR